MTKVKTMLNKAKYAEYEKAVAQFLKGNDIKSGCHGPTNPEQSDPFFSWTACECCERPEGGNRETYTFSINRHGFGPLETFEANICADCIYYLAYGKLDDQTMAEVEGGAV